MQYAYIHTYVCTHIIKGIPSPEVSEGRYFSSPVMSGNYHLQMEIFSPRKNKTRQKKSYKQTYTLQGNRTIVVINLKGFFFFFFCNKSTLSSNEIPRGFIRRPQMNGFQLVTVRECGEH